MAPEMSDNEPSTENPFSGWDRGIVGNTIFWRS